jgi:hypothetical protein
MSIAPDGSQTPVPVFTCLRPPNQPEVQSCDPTPIILDKDPIYLSFYGTGFRGADATKVTCLMNDLSMAVTYAGPQGTPGVDQINVRLNPALLAGTPTGAATWVEVVLGLNGVQANRAWIKVSLN